MSTLSERVEWILENRKQPDGRRWSQRGLSAASGLSPAHVGMMLRGDAKAVKAETLAGLARAAGVSLGWLLTGEGSPDHDDDTRGPSYSDDATPVLENVENWPEVVKADCLAHPDITPAEITTGSYTHADVWTLTLMLAIPMRTLRHASLARHIPRWAVRLRRALARTAERMAA